MEEEVILNKIIEDANLEASKIINEAKEKAREIEMKQQQQMMWLQKLQTRDGRGNKIIKIKGK